MLNPFGQLATLIVLRRNSKLVHDAVCVVGWAGTILAEPLPLKSCAEGTKFHLLVLLLLGKLQKHLEDEEIEKRKI